MQKVDCRLVFEDIYRLSSFGNEIILLSSNGSASFHFVPTNARGVVIEALKWIADLVLPHK
jgi:hypothetical protein